MLTVDQNARIRQLRRDGLTIRQIADQLHHSPKTILKTLENPEPGSTRPRVARPTPVFGPFQTFVDEILAADESAPRKQRHTVRQIHRRLVAEKGVHGPVRPDPPLPSPAATRPPRDVPPAQPRAGPTL